MVPRFAKLALTAYLPAMPKHIELPPRVAQAFVRDMRAFFEAKDQLKQDEIASRQLHALWAFQSPRELPDVLCPGGDVASDRFQPRWRVGREVTHAAGKCHGVV